MFEDVLWLWGLEFRDGYSLRMFFGFGVWRRLLFEDFCWPWEQKAKAIVHGFSLALGFIEFRGNGWQLFEDFLGLWG